jgi:hypothetical protein
MSLEIFMILGGIAPKIFLESYGSAKPCRTSGGGAAVASYKMPPVKIRAKLRMGKKVMIFWKLFNLLPGTIT